MGWILMDYKEQPLYTATYETGNTTTVVGVDIPISLPDQPPMEEMINYGLDVEDQVWYRVEVPDEFKTRNKARQVPWQKVKAFVDAMWHKRINGEWWLIKGEPVYIPGTAFVYLNFWQFGTNTFATFKIACVWWYQVMRHVELDRQVFGLIELKPRRAFSTEMALCWGWEVVTRFRDSKFGIMSKADDEAQFAFERLTFANERMIWFFKPKNSGTSRPAASLNFEYQAKRGGSATDVEDQQTAALNSQCWYEPTVQGKFDSIKLRASLFDEIGKILVSKMDVFRQWKIMRECLSLNVGIDIVGKCILPSTVEDLDNGRSIDIVQKMWDNSDPNNLSTKGRTISGCIRMFRPFWVSGKVDKWGFPDVDEARETRAADIAVMEAAGLHDDVTDYKRKYPETVHEALAKPAKETIFPVPIINLALERCRDIKEKDMSNPLRAIPGSLEWSNGFGSPVKWVPNPTGHWNISRHPDEPNKVIFLHDGRKAPGSTRQFGMGVDPIDHRKPAGEGSDGACTVGSVHDYVRDSNCSFDEQDVLISGEMWSDACCCDYVHRPEMPEQFYEDMLKTAIYYGCQMLVEKQKPGLINWGHEKGYGAYFAQKPVMADTRWASRSSSSPSAPNIAISATTETIQSYYGSIRSHILRRWMNYTHERLLIDMAKFTDKNRGERDLAVSWGWALTLLNGISMKSRRDRFSQSRESGQARELPLSLYPSRSH